jgi:glycerol-3-phosphate dehydrogenase (NAD(P)+)
MNRIAIIGAGAWGTALAVQAVRAGNQVELWARDPQRAATIADTRHNPRLPGVRLPDAVEITSTLPEKADLILLAVPMRHLRAVVSRIRPSPPMIACTKGMEQQTLLLPLELLAALHPGCPAAVLTGPNFAHEIAAGLPAATVVAAGDPDLREQVASLLGTPSFRLYGNDDPVGAQVGGAAKNVIAIAAGAVIGAGLGENARAGLITRGLAEIARLAVALGGKPETVSGLSGLGDLLLTCTGPSSRNYSLGLALGRGVPLASLNPPGSPVAEGMSSAPALVARAAGVDVPICREVASLLAGDTTVEQAMAALLARPRRDE